MAGNPRRLCQKLADVRHSGCEMRNLISTLYIPIIGWFSIIAVFSTFKENECHLQRMIIKYPAIDKENKAHKASSKQYCA